MLGADGECSAQAASEDLAEGSPIAGHLTPCVVEWPQALLMLRLGSGAGTEML